MITHKLLTAGCLLLAMSWITPLAAQNDTKEQLVVPLSKPNDPGFMEVHLVNGSIRVVGYSGKDVVIDAVSRQSKKEDRTEASANGMRRISTGSGMDIKAEERDNRIKVNSDSWKRPVDLTIKVPQRFTLKLGTVNQGDIVVDNVNGKLEVSNVNGTITLTNVSGSAVANTVNGNLIATFKSINTGEPMAFSTLNGNVDVTYPSNLKASVKLKSDQGDIYSDFEIDVDKNQPKTSRSGQSGMYRVTVEDWVCGKINGGGPEIMMKNMHGNIFVRKAK
ncbi:DUF4097 family beta strand repeat protein [Spirosoma taeanense]|uniref:DUF4097 family beta strand repeat protein n=1 Tax=Spirosoma taeanense TaxID=2735870 RepID=A0A6M5YDV1_9BACT|nr:DUF4097 family beta strand repeat-containing protein [Spirosoma taeanense]QJW91473.1 DUF4097 family beta strand repeat protein [Spirosoma taeanense]